LTALYVHQHASSLVAVRAVGQDMVQPPRLSATDRTNLGVALGEFVTEETGIASSDAVVDDGSDVVDAILERAAALPADVIVVGTHGRSGLRQFILGSVAEKVVRRASCAVLTVPPTASEDGFSSLRRILCALDFSAGALRALHYARDLAARCAAQLTVLHVIELPPDVPDLLQPDLTSYRARRFEQARAHMTAVLEPVRAACEASELLLVGRAGREIVRVATEQESDLVVMGVHGRGTADLAIFGSVTHHVVRHAPCPVLTVRLDVL
jgi:nucleotide-binding universal stress UspA family protein